MHSLLVVSNGRRQSSFLSGTVVEFLRVVAVWPRRNAATVLREQRDMAALASSREAIVEGNRFNWGKIVLLASRLLYNFASSKQREKIPVQEGAVPFNDDWVHVRVCKRTA